MTIHIDGIIYTLQRRGGISVYTTTLLEHLRTRDVPATVTIDGSSVQDLGASAPPVSLLTRPARRLERYRDCRPIASARLFHSSYYRRPAERRTPTVVTVYDFVYERFVGGAKRAVHSWQKNAAIRHAQSVMCISQSTKDDLLEFVGEVPGQTVEVVHLGVSEIFRPLAVTPAAVPFVLFVGERRGYKNFATLLRAMARLPDLELHCIGGGALSKEELEIVDERTRGRVRHLGFVDDLALNEHYNRAVCLGYPSRYEGFGIPVLEAMRAGCPVVSTRCKAVMEVGRDALTIADEDTPAAIALAIAKVTDNTYRQPIVQRGFQVAGGYSWRQTHERTLQVYQSLLGTLDT